LGASLICVLFFFPISYFPITLNDSHDEDPSLIVGAAFQK
jgi:hypothetical protein